MANEVFKLLDIVIKHIGQLARKRIEQHIIDKLDYNIVPVCPEQLSGLSTPRDPVEIQDGDGFDVWTKNKSVETIFQGTVNI